VEEIPQLVLIVVFAAVLPATSHAFIHYRSSKKRRSACRSEVACREIRQTDVPAYLSMLGISRKNVNSAYGGA
jgi:hypothetical protein